MQLIKIFYMADSTGGGGDSFDKANKSARDLKEQFATIKNVLHDVGASLQSSIGDQIDFARASMEGLDKATQKAMKGSLKSLTSELNKAALGVNKTRLQTEGLGKQFISSKKVQESINAAKTRQSNIENQLIELQMQGIVLGNKEMGDIQAVNEALEQQIKIEEKLLDNAQKREKAAGKIGELFKGLAKIPIVGGLIDAERVQTAINKKAEETGSRWQVLGAGLGAAFKSIGSALLDPLTYVTGIFSLLQSIVKLVIDFNSKTFEIAKNIGITVNEAQTLQQSFVDIANNSRNLGLVASDLAKTYAEMTTSLGFMVPANQKFLETATLIQKRTGASAEDMNALSLQASLSGKTLEDTMGTLEASRNIEGARSKLLLSQRQILEGIAKTSSAVLINFKGDVEALGDAVVRATKLGTSLDQINQQAESLLDFESSIQKEFELQVLTGRNINLTRARELALAGDTKGLMEELNKQQITYSSFTKENIIQRKAEADAVGLTVEQLSKQLLAQKQAIALGAEEGKSAQEKYNDLISHGVSQREIIRMLGSEQEAADLQKAAMADKFQAAMEKLQNTLASVLEGPVGGLINQFADFISKGENIKKIGNTLKTIFSQVGDVLKNWPQYLAKIWPYIKLIGAGLMAMMAASIITSLSAIPIVGPALGIAAAIAASIAIAKELLIPAPSFGGGGGGGEMTAPVNPATTAATAAEKTSTPANQGSSGDIHVHVKVGDEGWDKITLKKMQQYHAKNIQ